MTELNKYEQIRLSYQSYVSLTVLF